MMVLKRKEAHVDHKERERMKWVKSEMELFSTEFWLM